MCTPQKVEELQRRVSGHKSDELERSQHVRLSREQMQIQHAELTDTRHKVAQLDMEKVSFLFG